MEFNEVHKDETRSTAAEEAHQPLSFPDVVSEPGFTNIFTDAATDKRSSRAGLGITVWSPDRKLHATLAIPLDHVSEAVLAEALSIRVALQLALDLNLAVINILSDCKVVIDAINNATADESWLSIILHDIRRLQDSFWCCNFSFVKIGRAHV